MISRNDLSRPYNHFEGVIVGVEVGGGGGGRGAAIHRLHCISRAGNTTLDLLFRTFILEGRPVLFMKLLLQKTC